MVINRLYWRHNPYLNSTYEKQSSDWSIKPSRSMLEGRVLRVWNFSWRRWLQDYTHKAVLSWVIYLLHLHNYLLGIISYQLLVASYILVFEASYKFHKTINPYRANFEQNSLSTSSQTEAHLLSSCYEDNYDQIILLAAVCFFFKIYFIYLFMCAFVRERICVRVYVCMLYTCSLTGLPVHIQSPEEVSDPPGLCS